MLSSHAAMSRLLRSSRPQRPCNAHRGFGVLSLSPRHPESRLLSQGFLHCEISLIRLPCRMGDLENRPGPHSSCIPSTDGGTRHTVSIQLSDTWLAASRSEGWETEYFCTFAFPSNSLMLKFWCNSTALTDYHSKTKMRGWRQEKSQAPWYKGHPKSTLNPVWQLPGWTPRGVLLGSLIFLSHSPSLSWYASLVLWVRTAEPPQLNWAVTPSDLAGGSGVSLRVQILLLPPAAGKPWADRPPAFLRGLVCKVKLITATTAELLRTHVRRRLEAQRNTSRRHSTSSAEARAPPAAIAPRANHPTAQRRPRDDCALSGPRLLPLSLVDSVPGQLNQLTPWSLLLLHEIKE